MRWKGFKEFKEGIVSFLETVLVEGSAKAAKSVGLVLSVLVSVLVGEDWRKFVAYSLRMVYCKYTFVRNHQ